MTAGHIKRYNRRGNVTLAGVFERVLIEMGAEVTLGPYSIKDRDLEMNNEYDRVLVGLGPLKGLGTAYMYGAIQALNDFGELGSTRVAVFCDDTSTLKIGREFKTVLKRPYDYVKPFFSYKREWDQVQDQDSMIFNAHMSMISLLAGEGSTDWYWPVLMPSWTYDLAYVAGSRVCTQAAHNVISFDPSVYFEHQKLEHVETDEDPFWATAWKIGSPQVKRMGVESWSVENFEEDVTYLREASGILVPSAIWTPDIHMGARLGVPVATDWRTLGPHLGESFEALPANVEMMSRDERSDLAAAQLSALKSRTARSTREALEEWL